jgi:nicotinamidase-related amidase
MIRAARTGETVAFAPLLVCADLQQEALAGDETAAALGRCAMLLALWRERRWPVAHLRRIARPSWFDLGPDRWDWIDGFKPYPGELAFEHALPSAFSSTRFAEYARNIRPSPNFLIGCSLDETILATTIDGYHRGQQFHVIEDAVLCTPRIKPPGTTAVHRSTVLHILQVFGERICSEAVITPLSHDQTLAVHYRRGRSNQ